MSKVPDDSKNRPAPGTPAPEDADVRTGCAEKPDAEQAPREIGGRDGPDPTRYGDWEKNGRCIDF